MEIHRIDDLRPYVQPGSLCLFDVDETLISNRQSLGCPKWRGWVKPHLGAVQRHYPLYDALTFFIAQKVPYVPCEPSTPALIADLSESATVCGFTARGRTQWYSTEVEGVDRFTHDQLKRVGIDFHRQKLPGDLHQLNPDYFYDGIIFSRNEGLKGEVLIRLFNEISYRPGLLIFVDDRLDQVQSVEKAALELGIPFIGFWYTYVYRQGFYFDPHVTNVQLEHLFRWDEMLTDSEAAALVGPGGDASYNLQQIIRQHAPRIWPLELVHPVETADAA
jgi:hypothetical protein